MSLQPNDRPIVLLRGDAEGIAHAWPIVDAALRRCPGFGLVIAVSADDFDAVRRRYSHEIVVAAGAEPPPGTALQLDASNPGTSEDIYARLLASGYARDRRPRAFSPTDLDAPGGQRIASLGDLKARLGDSRTILCLGNGPSSEAPGLDAYGDATLFRVNWNWLHRGLLDQPHLVFTADPDLPPAHSPAILALPTATVGLPILLGHAQAGRPPAAGYLFLDQLSPPPADFDAAIIPTNGALMIAVAAALQPKQLVIAGMDLYRHPGGRYPGHDAVDGYSREHSAACDLDLIRAALRGFQGKTKILSANLSAALERP